jgi:hypothetical protein
VLNHLNNSVKMPTTCGKCNGGAVACEPVDDVQFLKDGVGQGGCTRWMNCSKCSKCNTTWFACSLCPWRSPLNGTMPTVRNRKRKIMEPVAAHYYSPEHQNAAQLVYTPAAIPPSGDHKTNNFVGDIDDDTPNLPRPTIEQVYSSVDQSELETQKLFSTIKNANLQQFVTHEAAEPLKGRIAIVTRAFTKDNRPLNQATAEGADFLGCYARLYANMSVADRNEFVWFARTALAMPPEDEAKVFGPVKIPRNFKDADRQCITGANSVMKATPIPGMEIVGDGKGQHVVVEPSDILQCLFAHIPVDACEGVDVVTLMTPELLDVEGGYVCSYFESKAYREEFSKTHHLLKDAKLPASLLLSFKLWSDSWDPDSTKNNRNGIWSFLWTFMLGQDGPRVVFPVAIGPKSGDHDVAIRWFFKRLKAMGEFPVVRYVHAKKNVRVNLRLGLYNVDRLERGEIWGGLNHASNRGKCHGVVHGYDTVFHPKHPACCECLKFLVHTMSTMNGGIVPDQGSERLAACKQCGCYEPVPSNHLTSGEYPEVFKKKHFLTDYDGNLNDLKAQISMSGGGAPHTGEKHCIVGDPSQPPLERPVGPNTEQYNSVRVSKAFLVGAAQFLTYQCWKGAVTTKVVAKTWGQVCGLSDRLWLKLFDHAKRHRKNGTKDFRNVFTEDLLPSVWLEDGIDITKFLDAPMHLLFLGIIQKIMEMIDEWMAFGKMKASVTEYNSNCCDVIGKVSLRFVKLLKYGVTTLSRGSWVSEQYVGFSKYMFVAYAGLVYSKKAPASEVKAVLRVIDSCFLVLSLLMTHAIDRRCLARAPMAIKVYLAAVDQLGKIIDKKAKRATAFKQPPTSQKLKEQGTSRKRKSEEATSANALPTAKELPINEGFVEGIGIDTDTGSKSQDHDEQKTEQDQVSPSATHPVAASVPQNVDNTQPISLENPNHASLLNIVGSMAKFGPPVDQWEGADEKQIQYIKPFFHGVCVVDGGQVEAAFKRYYRSRFSSIVGEMLAEASVLRTDEEPKERERFLRCKRYSSIDDVRGLITANREVACVLYTHHGGAEQAICAIIKGKDGMDNIYRLTLGVVHPFCNEEIVKYGRDFISFASLSIGSKADSLFVPGEKFQHLGTLLLVPGNHIWRDRRHSTKIVFDSDSMYTVIGEQYQFLTADGLIRPKFALAPSLWKDVEADGTMSPGTDTEVDLEDTDWSFMTVIQLKAELEKRNLPKSGFKKELVRRLEDFEASKDDSVPQ